MVNAIIACQRWLQVIKSLVNTGRKALWAVIPLAEGLALLRILPFRFAPSGAH